MSEKVFIENIHTATDIRPYYSLSNENLDYVMHCHAELETIYVERGEVNIVTDEKCVRARKGDICLFLPSEIHNIVTVKDSNCHVLKAYPLKSTDGARFYNSRLIKNVVCKNDAEYDCIYALMKRIENESKENRIGSDLAILILAGEIQLAILRSGLLCELPSDLRRRKKRHTEMLDAVNGYIAEHYSENISLDEISSVLYVSRCYFAHTFKKIANMTFYEYLTRFRLDKAVKLLSTGSSRITDISLDCGFGSLRSFDRAFKKYFDMTPGEYMCLHHKKKKT